MMSSRTKGANPIRSITLFAFFALSTSAIAGGPLLSENNSSSMGSGFAGAASEGNDPSIIYTNPAGLTRFKRTEVTVGGVYAQASSKYTTVGDIDTTAGSATPNVADGTSFEKSPVKAVGPFIYAAFPLTERLTVGASVSGAAVLVVKYPENYPGRSNGTDVDLKLLRFNAGAGYKLTKTLSAGINASIYSMYTGIKPNVNLGNSFSRLLFGTPAAAPLLSPIVGEVRIVARTVGIAAQAQYGLLWEPTERLRMGISYRPKFTAKTRGYVRIEYDERQESIVGIAGGNPLTANIGRQFARFQQAQANITLPDELHASIFYNANPKLDLMFGYQRQDNSVTEIRYFRTADDSTFIAVPQDFGVTQKYAIGANIRGLYKDLTVRVGFGKENSAVNDEFRVSGFPEGDRTYYSAGFNYVLDKDTSIDFAAHVWQVPLLTVGNNDRVEPDYITIPYNGKVKQEVFFIGTQVNKKF